jgi:hypothetical protein
MATAENTELIDRFDEFYRDYYRNEIGELAQKYPKKQKSLYVDWDDLSNFDPELADDYQAKPEQIQEYAEEALRLYDLPVDVSLGQAHVRLRNLPNSENICDLRHEHHGNLVAITGIVREATDTQPKVIEAAFECQRCGTLTRIPQVAGDFQEPHDCQGCERQGPFRLNTDQSQFIDAQKLQIQDSSKDLADGSIPESISVNIEDDITGYISAGDYVTATGIIKLDQQESNGRKSPTFDLYMEGVAVERSEDLLDTDPFETRQTMEQYASNATRALGGMADTPREEETKAKLITPLLQALGWDKYDNAEFRMEYVDEKTSKRPDYALFAPSSDSPDIVVEAKKFDTTLQQKESQLYTYLKVFDAAWGILSNGQEHWIYRNADPAHLVAKVAVEDSADADILESLSKTAVT